jgi:hypothetical protein
VEKFVCSTDNSVCMYGDCETCRAKTPSVEIPKLYPQLDLDEEVSWMKWQKMDDKFDIHRLTGTVSALLLEIDHQWPKFTTHSYITTSQFEYIKNLKETVAADTAIIHMDFSENYVCILI